MDYEPHFSSPNPADLPDTYADEIYTSGRQYPLPGYGKSHPPAPNSHPPSPNSHPPSMNSPSLSPSRPLSLDFHPPFMNSHPPSMSLHPPSPNFHPRSINSRPPSPNFHPHSINSHPPSLKSRPPSLVSYGAIFWPIVEDPPDAGLHDSKDSESNPDNTNGADIVIFNADTQPDTLNEFEYHFNIPPLHTVEEAQRLDYARHVDKLGNFILE